MFYPLATDSEDETEEWISVLTRAIGLEVEETDRVPGVCVCVCVCRQTGWGRDGGGYRRRVCERIAYCLEEKD